MQTQSNLPSATGSIFVIIPAAGLGTRMGASLPKVLMPLGDRKVIEHTVRTIGSIDDLAALVILAPQSHIDEFKKLDFAASCPVHIEVGGEMRQDSVRLGLNFLQSKYQIKNGDLILIHDAARCLASRKLVSECVDAARNHGAAVAAIPVVDTIKEVSAGGTVIRTVDRSVLRAMQTPQVFRFEILSKGLSQNAAEVTDDVALVEKFHPVRIVPGETTNIKITTPEDYALAKAWIGRGIGS